jgi:hypothetical protein
MYVFAFHVQTRASLCYLLNLRKYISTGVIHDACEFAYRKKLMFPAVYNCFKLLFTAPVTVAKNERSFSKMKIIKNFLRSTMSGERQEDLIVLAAEKDLTDKIDLDVVLKAWTAKKNRKLQIKLTR